MSITRELIQNLYWEKELNQRLIAESLGCSQALVSKLMKKYHISIRRPPNFKGHKHSEESKRKISEAKRGKASWNKGLKGVYHLSDNTKSKISIAVSKALKGHEVSEEARRKIRESKRGKPAWNKGLKRWWESPTEYKKGLTPWNKNLKGVMKAWNKGKKENLSEEARNKIRLAHLGKPSWNKGLSHKEETKEKLRNARLKQVFPTEDTNIEEMMQNALLERGIPFEKHKPIIGQPDIFIEPDICIFCDGDYWHTLPNVKAKDEKITKLLQEKGYRVLRFSEKEILNNIKNCVRTIEEVM